MFFWSSVYLREPSGAVLMTDHLADTLHLSNQDFVNISNFVSD